MTGLTQKEVADIRLAILQMAWPRCDADEAIATATKFAAFVFGGLNVDEKWFYQPQPSTIKPGGYDLRGTVVK